MLVRICLLIVSFSFMFNFKAFCQKFNNDYSKSYINISLPKTPESQSFEKYGNIPVDEYSGAANVSVPIYNLKGRFLDIPVSLSYHASGIKVNQEATWVGLGFDLIAGGRITVETKGNVDDYVRNYTSQQQFKNGLRRIMNKWKAAYMQSPNASVLGYAYLDYGKLYGNSDPIYHSNDTLWDDNYTITNSAWFGISEPDIYHANFGGTSLNFYIDLYDEQIKFLGEKSLFNVSYQRDTSGISQFTIIDNSGKKYLFEQREFTKLNVPPAYGFNSHIYSASSWLLTKVIHPLQDTIILSYSNYGDSYPAPSWSASISCTISGYSGTSISNGVPNQITQTPYYLTQIQSANTLMNFSLSGREDLRGAGAKKLDKIEVRDKITNSLIKEIQFTYDYFISTLEAYENSLPDSVKNCYKKRLRLLSVNEFNSTNSKPWSFYYNSQTGPGKMSFAQDHWGYFNGVDNTADYPLVSKSEPVRLIPTFTHLGSLASRNPEATLFEDLDNCKVNNGSVALPGVLIPTAFDGMSNGRNCNSTKITVYLMDSIVYPTGGASKFEYEPHKSNYFQKSINELIGGGLRIKSIKNYAFDNKLESTVEYDYMNSGVYLGTIEYLRVSNRWPSRGTATMSSNGILSDDGQSVGYTMVKKQVRDYLNQINTGYTLKYYYANSALPVQYTNSQFPFPTSTTCINRFLYTPQLNFLSLNKSGNTQMPARQLDGKLFKEEVYNATGTKVKSSETYYRQAELTNPLYSLKVSDNYDGYPGIMGAMISTCLNDGTYPDWGFGNQLYCPVGWRRWEVCLTPAVSYYTLLDSVIEKTLGVNGNYLVQKKSFFYNKYYQQEVSTTYNSDYTQSIQLTKTPLSFEHPPIPNNGENDAYQIEQLKSNHIYDVPVEQLSISRSATGDSMVTGGIYNVYQLSTPKKVFLLETNTPLLYKTQFIPTYYYYNYPALPSFNITKDSKYRLQDSAEYYPNSLVKELSSIKGKQSIIWDESYYTVLATCLDASITDIAFSSFESATKGNWVYLGTPIYDQTAPTGYKAYSLNNGSITKPSLNTAKTYTVSYWSKNGVQNVNGTSAFSGKTTNGYTYYEHRVANPASGLITISGTGTIDELRLYPEKSQMTSYTYKPLIGVNSICDPSSKIVYYEYDEMNRMTTLRDQDRRILKKVQYKLQTCPTQYTNTQQSRSFFKNTCGTGYVSTPVVYTISAEKYSSCTSQAEVDALIESDFNTNGQAFANNPVNGATCSSCSGSYSAASGWTSFYTSFTPNSNVISLTLVVAATNTSSFSSINSGVIIGTITSACCRPSVARTFSCSESGRMWSLTVYPNGQVMLVRTGGAALPSVNQGFTLTGSFSL